MPDDAIKLNTVVTILSIVTFVGGGVALVWKASAINSEVTAQVEMLRNQVDEFKSSGGVRLQTHIVEDTREWKETKERLDRLERAIDMIQPLQLAVAGYSGRLDVLEIKMETLRGPQDNRSKSSQPFWRGKN